MDNESLVKCYGGAYFRGFCAHPHVCEPCAELAVAETGGFSEEIELAIAGFL